MMLPLIGIPACTRELSGHLQHATPARYAAAVAGGAGGIPLLIPPVGELTLAVLRQLDGILLSGSPSNVEPSRYGVAEDRTPDLHDPMRDATTLPLIRAALTANLPILGICRGLQEMNVALGGTLHQQVQDIPGRADHRGGPGDAAQRYRPKHAVRLSGSLADLVGQTDITVNSVHGQAIDRPAPGAVVEAVAPDGTIEAICFPQAAFAHGVQWHPEWQYADDPASLALLRAFGDACRSYAAHRRSTGVKPA